MLLDVSQFLGILEILCTCFIYISNVHGIALKSYDDGTRDCRRNRGSLYPVDRLSELYANGSDTKPYLTWINHVVITDQARGFSINVEGKMDLQQCMPVICWDPFSSKIKALNTRLRPRGDVCRYDDDDYYEEAKFIFTSDLISLVQQNAINLTQEYVVINFNSYGSSQRRCFYLDKQSTGCYAINCSDSLPALCFDVQKSPIYTVISIRKLCQSGSESSDDQLLSSECNKRDDAEDSDTTTSVSETGGLQLGSSLPIDPQFVIIISAVIGLLILITVTLLCLKWCRQKRSLRDHGYATRAIYQNNIDDAHKYAVPTEYENTRDDVPEVKTYTHDYITVI